MAKHQNLFKPMNIGKVQVKNRYFMAPMGGTGLCGPQGEFSEKAIEFYVERAKGGVGAIFTGVSFTDSQVDPSVAGKCVDPNYSPSKFKETAVPMCERIHAYGAKVFMQLSVGTGRNGMQVSPSDLPYTFNPGVNCRAITKEEIKKKIEQEVQAAVIAKDSGFDGVEVHAIHEGYLLDQFAMAYMNKRTDEYGGSLENRLRFATEICQGIKEKCGADFPVTVRLGMKTYIKGFNKPSIDGEGEVGRTLEEAIEICKLLEQAGYDALSVDSGVYDSFYWVHPPMYQPKGLNIDLGKAAKQACNLPIILAGRMDEPELANDAIASGSTDGIAIGRCLLADADYCNKVLVDQEDTIRPCLACHMGCLARIFAGKPIACAVNAAALREKQMELIPTLAKKNILIVGGGVGGMEAARVAKIRGHKVTLLEKSSKLGGNLIPAGVPDFKEDDRKLVLWYQQELKKLDVDIKFNSDVDTAAIVQSDADVVILATGSDPIMPDIPGIDHQKSVSCIDALLGKTELGQNVVVVGGGLVGCELALEASKKQKQVTIVEALPKILSAGVPIPVPNAMMLADLMTQHQVDIRTSCRIKEVNDTGAVISLADGGEETIAASNVVFAIGFRSRNELYKSVTDSGKLVYEIGDGKQVANILSAIWDAYEIAKSI